jgi:hypothetical protein
LKSYFLEGLRDQHAAEALLSLLLPGQTDPWLLLAEGGDPIAYFHPGPVAGEEDALGPFLVQVDISGRHYNEDDVVLRVLRLMQAELGGQIRDDDDNQL